MNSNSSHLILHHPQRDSILSFLAARHVGEVEIGVLLGSGLSGVIDRVDIENQFAYTEIEGHPPTRIPGHPGRLIVGRLGNKRCVFFAGRFHFYEGASAAEVTLPIQLAVGLGARAVVLTCSAGGINKNYRPGDLVFIADHLNFSGANPLAEMIMEAEDNPFAAGKATPFVNLINAYRTDLYTPLRQSLSASDITLQKGVLAMVLGPNYESDAEVRMFRASGADVICMSTVPEVIYARYAGLDVVALSLVTNMAGADVSREGPSHGEVLAAAAKNSANFTRAVEETVRLI